MSDIAKQLRELAQNEQTFIALSELSRLQREEIDSLRQQLAESQARIAELEGALEQALDDMGEAGHSVCPACKELMTAVLANKSPSDALERAITKAKVEALEDVAGEIEKTVWKTISIRSVCLKIRRMADELRGNE